jgi:hypothetical protein
VSVPWQAAGRSGLAAKPELTLEMITSGDSRDAPG